MHHTSAQEARTSLGRLTMIALVAASLAACGGGGGSPGVGGVTGSPGTGTGTPATPASAAVTVAFVNASGQTSNTLSGATPLTVRATVLDAAGKPVPNALVSFATDADLAVFSASAGTALTDASGVATMTMRTASLSASGAGKVTVTASVGETTLSGSANYSVGATALALGNLTVSPASISAYGTAEVSVDLLANGAKYTGQQVNVNFSSACASAGKATLASTVATNNGTARATYRDLGCGNNDVITVSSDAAPTSATATLAIAAPAAASVQFVSATPSDQSIVIQGQGGINRSETATLKFKVIDVFDRPLAGKQVNFSVSPAGVVRLNKSTDSTDQNGEVITTVNSGTVPTSFRVTATLPGTAGSGRPDISTSSDSIVVTTGQTTQRAMSLSVTDPNPEGWNFDSGTTEPATVFNILLADQFGNPVADGTPVVFQTNLGAIGSSSRGGCLTENGGCSVDFRTQNPRVAIPGQPATACNSGGAAGVSADSTRAGVATICASTTDGVSTQFRKAAIFFSGSFVQKVYLNGSATPLNIAATTTLSTVSSALAKTFRLQLNDLNDNPLPSGTKVEVTGLNNANLVDAQPAEVPKIFPHSGSGDDPTGNNISGPQGSTHVFSLKSPNAANCTVATTASFNVKVTTPNGNVSLIPFQFNFSCP
ncbi:Ig-like domain-containing protein [Massilia sp. ST3]|uniref:Ig-like domain-containing protein n=1 Tax=Massilia sp. ST3 TaxID=2824903 RepID=UPI001B814F7E|nr:Ig-like domain-containing protein [Massilia sp. ST3]MBQ5949177.1 Ig-like domain-containing protein [Massilia sp. ST3]